MSGDDSMFDEQLAALARFGPREAVTRKALEAAQAALLQARAARQRKRRLWMRMMIPSGIAAAVIGAALLVTWPTSTRSASAADQLQQAVDATNAYKGWVHWTQVPHAAVGAPEPGAGPIPKRMTRHINPELGITALVVQFDNDLSIDMEFKSRREMASYQKSTGEIHLTTLSEAEIKSIDQATPPATVSDILSTIKEKLGRDPISVKEAPDGDLTRFDVVLFASDDEAEAFRASKGLRMSIGKGLSVWINKEKLITRMHMEPPASQAKGVGAMDITVTYGPPEFKDIYDLGVPRDAKLVDMRVGDLAGAGAPAALATLKARLQDRREKGFGDGVALLSSYFIDSAGQHIETRSGNVTLFITQGDKWLANQYLLFLPATSLARTKPVLKEAPTGWPAPDIAKLLPALHAAPPQLYWIMNGEQGWYGSLNGDVLSMKPATPALRELFAMQTLSTQLWPDLSKMSADLVMQEDLLRLRGKMLTTARDGGAAVMEWTDLLDLAKDDLPQQRYSYTVKAEAGEVADRQTTHYSSFAKLPNGQWYPTDWTMEQVQRDPATGADNGYVQKFHLQILPGLKVDEGWFTDPRSYVGK